MRLTGRPIRRSVDQANATSARASVASAGGSGAARVRGADQAPSAGGGTGPAPPTAAARAAQLPIARTALLRMPERWRAARARASARDRRSAPYLTATGAVTDGRGEPPPRHRDGPLYAHPANGAPLPGGYNAVVLPIARDGITRDWMATPATPADHIDRDVATLSDWEAVHGAATGGYLQAHRGQGTAFFGYPYPARSATSTGAPAGRTRLSLRLTAAAPHIAYSATIAVSAKKRDLE